MEGEKIYIADKRTVDQIVSLLLSSEIGLAVLKDMLSDSAGAAETTAGSIETMGVELGRVKEYLADNVNGLGAIKETVEGKANAEAVATINSLLENGTYGLNAIKDAINGRANESTSTAIKALLENTTYGLNALKSAINGRANESTSTAIKALLENASTGLGALKAAITGRANESTVTAVKSLLENGTYGLNALKTAITGNVKAIKSVQRGSVSINSSDKVFTINISSVNTSKAFALASQGLSYVNDTNVANTNVFVELTSATTIRIGAGASTGRMAWQVIEFY